ncbi:hypothetical protein N783_05730 [Pontibacillus marinus BH030004 = DSM 16465]|uniref:GrpB family protein n=1 Tax=Pontibacillus marinus BH030004 = DSM 16465 TaxID=1385511 RepID=A0A0A5FWW5_9BACI|nr:hypothetical protein N783_05730 [Pontibacillus marinus BH030004 = DSM 16465]QHE52775.1 hypothetical protein GS400_12390 [Pontibacillus sp. HMF3514]
MTHYAIEVVDFDERWVEQFNSIKQVISRCIGQLILDVEHVGSTSVKGLPAMPILDFLIRQRES